MKKVILFLCTISMLPLMSMENHTTQQAQSANNTTKTKKYSFPKRLPHQGKHKANNTQNTQTTNKQEEELRFP